MQECGQSSLNTGSTTIISTATPSRWSRSYSLKLDAVVFFDLSRLTRKGISHAVKLLDEWKTAGVKPICFSFPALDFTDESGTGELIACLLAWQAKVLLFRLATVSDVAFCSNS